MDFNFEEWIVFANKVNRGASNWTQIEAQLHLAVGHVIIQDIRLRYNTEVLGGHRFPAKTTGRYGNRLVATPLPHGVKVTAQAGYSKYVEKGRGAGEPPPVSAIQSWLVNKGIGADANSGGTSVEEDDLMDEFEITGEKRERKKRGRPRTANPKARVWYLASKIAENIGEQGTEPRNFMTEVFRRGSVRGRITSIIEDSISKLAFATGFSTAVRSNTFKTGPRAGQTFYQDALGRFAKAPR